MGAHVAQLTINMEECVQVQYLWQDPVEIWAMKTITLPEGVRVTREQDALVFERPEESEDFTGPKRMAGAVLVLAIFGLPLVLYVWVAQADWSFSGGERVLFHLLFGGIGFFIFAAALRHVVQVTRFRQSRLGRMDSDHLELDYVKTNGRSRSYRIEEPATFVILLHTTTGGVTGWEKATDATGETKRRRYGNLTEVQLTIRAKSVSAWLKCIPRGWLEVMPEPLRVKHLKYDPEANLEEVMGLLAPLADYVQEVLRMPVEYRVAGGPLLARPGNSDARSVPHRPK